MDYTLKFFGPRANALGTRIGQGGLQFESGGDVAAVETAKKLCAERTEGVPYARLIDAQGKQVWESGSWDA